MRFKDLNKEQIDYFCETYKRQSSQDADRQLSELFNVSERTVRNWAKSFGLTGRTEQTFVLEPVSEAESVTIERNHSAKILVFDLETAPLKAHVFGMWKQSIGYNLDMLISDWFMFSWSAKWLFEEDTMGDVLTPEEAIAQDDKRIMESLWHLIEEADIIIAHNLIKFDEKRMNTRFLLNGLPKPSPYQRIDTLLHARKRLAISSNKLDYLGQVLGVGGKQETGGFKLWAGCYNGDPDSLKKMLAYNVRDIDLLEDVYLALRPYIQPHPNMGLWIAEDVKSCPTCGAGEEELEHAGTYMTNASLFDSVRCNNCGSVGRERRSNLKAGDKQNLLMPAAR